MVTRRTLSAIVACLLVVAGKAYADNTRVMTATDAIEMVEAYEPGPISLHGRKPSFQSSPDGEMFAAVLRQGSLKTGRIKYTLRVFHYGDVAKVMAGQLPEGAIEGTVVAEMESPGSRPAIEQVAWVDNGRVSYIGRTADDRGGIYISDIASNNQTRLHREDGDIIQYALSKDSRTLVYSTPDVPDWTERNSRGYVVHGESAFDLEATNPRHLAFLPTAYYFKRGAEKPVRIDVPPQTYYGHWGALPQMKSMSVSPDGRHAVILTGAKDVDGSWAEYAYLKKHLTPFLKGSPGSTLSDLVRKSTLGEKGSYNRSAMVRQFYLVTASRAGAPLKVTAAPLVNAPVSTSAGWNVSIEWHPERNSVVVAPALLPLDATTGSERARRTKANAVIEVGLTSGEVNRVADEGDGRFVGLQRRAKGLCVYSRDSQGASVEECLSPSDKEWIKATAMDVAAPQQIYEIDIREDANTPPNIIARDIASGQTKVIKQLNPGLAEIALGELVEVKWDDPYGRTYKAGLVYPPGYERGKRYPLVIQSTGYTSGEFLVDGGNGMSSAYAARPLAGKGMVVLVLPHISTDAPLIGKAFDWKVDSEMQRFSQMVESAIDHLDQSGMIDRERVGIIGFSHGGMNLLHTLTFSSYHFRAATIADSSQTTPLSYVMQSGIAYPMGMYGFEVDNYLGGPLWGEGIKQWLERSPAYHLDKISTPLRFETYGVGFPEIWDTYAQLKRHGRPVEYLLLPNAVHQLEPPWSRYSSQQGNVDWFTFWLKGEENKDHSPLTDYESWRAMRAETEVMAP